MKNKEKQLFKQLCNFKSESFDTTLLEYATPHVLGQLFYNRMQGIAYGTLKENNLLARVNREFRNSLQGAYEQNKEKNKSFFQCIEQLNEALTNCKCKYAMLKGAMLCKSYPEGYRTSNDIDLLVLPEDVSEIGDALTKAGFMQGHIWNGEFILATRREIITSKMMRGETVPYIKEINLPGMKFLEVDINFSLDYKNGDTDVLKEILSRVQKKSISGLEVPTMDNSDFFIHLCTHLHKEATTLPWVEMHRDMTMYKYADIYMLLSDMTESDTRNMFARAKELGVEKICSFTILQTAALFDVANISAIRQAEEILQTDPEFIHTVISPVNKKIFVYTEHDIAERFFSDNRKNLLKEVQI